RALGRLLVTPLAVARQLERGVEQSAEVSAVVDQRNLRRRRSQLPRELRGLDEVAATQLDGIDPKLPGEVVHAALEGEARLGLSGAAIRARGRLAREDGPYPARVIPKSIRARQDRRRDGWTEHAETSRVRAHVGEQFGAHRQDRAIAAGRQLHVVPLLAGVRRAQYVLAPRLDPFDGRAEAHGRPWKDHLLA